MSNQQYNLKARICQFGKYVIIFANCLPKNTITLPLISQIIRSSTSIGVNYYEADNAESKKDIIHKLGIAKKEAGETVYWVEMMITACPNFESKALPILQEDKELNLIFNAIIN